MGANLVGMPYIDHLLVGIEIEYKQSIPELLQNDAYVLLTNLPFIRDMHEPSNKRYFVINRKCQETLTIKKIRHFPPTQFDKMIVQILEILVHLENSNIAHGDIKLDNIMICNNNYRLIDWEQGRILDYTKIKTSISLGACPAYYILKFGNEWKAVFSLAIPFIIKVTACNDIGHKNKSQYIYDAIDYYQQQFDLDHNEKYTFNRIKYTFDLFTFGLILYGILEHNSVIRKSNQFDKYNSFVHRIYKYNSAKEALADFIN
jgi:serine/threonine protein kinase